jgi:hypothetical protein
MILPIVYSKVFCTFTEQLILEIMSRYFRPKNELIVKVKKYTKKQIEEMKAKEEELRHSRNGVFGSIW